ncbi:MAG TPA: hypothetical protein VH498_07805 [Candidatus Dormibacteraeota bacterium]|nr:hypothetical protein [Candidatus Dormibacteraeota bacterium]
MRRTPALNNSRGAVEWQRASGEVRRLHWLFGDDEPEERPPTGSNPERRARWWGSRTARPASH